MALEIRGTGAGKAPRKSLDDMSSSPFLFGPFSQPVTPHLNKNQSFEDTQRHQQHDHPLLVYHVLFPSILPLAKGLI